MTRIHLTKDENLRLPDTQVIRLQDDSSVIEGVDVDDIASQLRQKYPEDTYERFLRRERDHGAYVRKAEAIAELIRILVRAACRDSPAQEVVCAPMRPKPHGRENGALSE